nr:hypothetical protein GCM10017745_49340 [Saccharothrix mutabilis subsp. capreolus]
MTAPAANFAGPDTAPPYIYAAFADVTSAFASASTGTAVDITVGNIYSPEGRGCSAGWSLDIVWEYPEIEPTHAPTKKHVYIYNGLVAQDATRTDITISGFQSSTVENRVGLTVFDGDPVTGDSFLINNQQQTEPTNGTTNNFFISRTEGSTNPNLMDNLSIDAKTLTTDDIPPGSTSATLSFTSSGDGYFPTNLIFAAALADLLVEKTVDPPVVHEGDTVTFTITVTNASGLAVDNITVADASTPSCDADVGTLQGGESTTYTCTTTAPSDDFTNAVIANGTDQFGEELAGADTVDVDVIHPAVEITKTVSPATAQEGDPVTYTITVTNTGDVDLTTVQVSDPQLAVCDRQFPTLAVAAVETYTCDSTAPAADLTNTATVTGTDPLGLQVTDTASATLDVVTMAFTMAKSASTTNAAAGEVVTYTLTVTNTGDTALQGVVVTDDLTGVVDDATFGSATTTTGTATFTTPTLTWTGDLPVGAVATITYTVTVGNPPAGDGNLHNVVTSTSSGAPDTPVVTDTPIASFTITKTVDRQSALPGDTVTYTVTVTNTGQVAYTAPNSLTVTDDLTGVVDDATFGNATATTGTATFTTPTLTWTGDLAIGAAATITYTVTVNDPPGGDNQLVNAVSSTTSGAPQQPTTTNTPIASFTITKSIDNELPAAGDTVTYTVTVTNTGQTDYTAPNSITITDDLTGVVDDATFGTATATTGTATFTSPTLTWTGDLAIGATATITYTVTVNDPPGGDTELVNAVTSTTSGGPAQPVVTDTPIGAFTLAKTIDPTNAAAGDTVTYTVTVTNTSQADYTGTHAITVTDDLTGVVDDATFGTATATTGTTTFTSLTLTWTGELPAGATATITYTATLNNPPTGDGNLHNVVSSTTSGAPDTPVTTDTPVASFSITKTVDRQSAQPGDTVTYTVTVTNTGQTDYTTPNSLTVTDDLSGVLDDAAFGTATATAGTATFASPTLTWTGDLAIGATATITYTATLNDPSTGDATLHNVVTSTTPGGPSGPTTTDTTVQTPTPPSALPDTGRPWSTLLVACLAFLTAGAATLTTTRLLKAHR